jgi:catechol 2,3-dioxygenase-like lactoylglutathione lyase family enzyme
MNHRIGTPVAFINVTDRQRALDFYCETLGFTHRSADEHGDFVELDGALLRITELADWKAIPHPVLGWNVDDLVAVVHTLRDRGIAFTIYEGMGQDELGIWTSPDGQVQVAYFSDPDGNVLSLAKV